MIANLMVFYKGGFSYSELQDMPLPDVFRWQKYAIKINKERQREAKK